MCLTASVGPIDLAPNRPADVKAVQTLLNLNGVPNRPLKVDGAVGPLTLRAIDAFERGWTPDAANGLIEPRSRALSALRRGLPAGWSREKLTAIFPAATPELLDLYFEPLSEGMARAGINTPLRMAHFIAQIGHESGEFRYTEEIASGEAYEGRVDLGNSEPGDGPRFKGRGLIHITGRKNYTAYSNWRGIDFTRDRQWELLGTDPFTAADSACWFWKERGLNRWADSDDLHAVTRKVNGGYNGFPDRAAKFERAKFFLVPA